MNTNIDLNQFSRTVVRATLNRLVDLRLLTAVQADEFDMAHSVLFNAEISLIQVKK